jgi:hypothetical protein
MRNGGPTAYRADHTWVAADTPTGTLWTPVVVKPVLRASPPARSLFRSSKMAEAMIGLLQDRASLVRHECAGSARMPEDYEMITALVTAIFSL